jgi:hypothetical protein
MLPSVLVAPCDLNLGRDDFRRERGGRSLTRKRDDYGGIDTAAVDGARHYSVDGDEGVGNQRGSNIFNASLVHGG